MIKVRHAEERGLTRLSWLESRHSFSFGDYHDPDQTGFRALRVINEDKVAPGRGFAPHSHKDMEIVTYMLAGRAQGSRDKHTGGIARRALSAFAQERRES